MKKKKNIYIYIYFPVLQYSHILQGIPGSIVTLSPFFKLVTSSPTSSIIPEDSCPTILINYLIYFLLPKIIGFLTIKFPIFP